MGDKKAAQHKFLLVDIKYTLYDSKHATNTTNLHIKHCFQLWFLKTFGTKSINQTYPGTKTCQ